MSQRDEHRDALRQAVEDVHTAEREGAALDAVVLPSPRDPVAVARRFVTEHYTTTGHLVLRRWHGGWWTWRGACWAELDDAKVRAELYAFTENAIYLTEKTEKPWEPNRYKVADLCDALGAVSHLPEHVQPPTWTAPVDAPPAGELVATRNGLLHVPTRDHLAHDPRLFNMVAVPFDYAPNVGPPERWLEFLAELWPDDPDSVAALQEFFGYVISGRTDLHKILLLVGPTRAGKGVIARILKNLVGRGNYRGPTLASLGTNFGLAPLIGKPLAIIADARLGGANVHQVVERLLSISGEDMLTIDRKYREPWTGTLPTRFLLVSNELPRFGDASGAIANRFVVLALTRSWLGRENTALTDELRDELPGILNWSLDGLERLHRVGRFTEPAASHDAVSALQDLVSPVAAFVRDCCDRRGDTEVICDTLYAAWKDWADENGHRPGSSATFGRDLRAAVPGLHITRPREGDVRVRRYRGIRLATRTDNEWSSGPGGPRRVSRSAGPPGPADQPLSAHVGGEPPAGVCDRCGLDSRRRIEHHETHELLCPDCCRELDEKGSP